MSQPLPLQRAKRVALLLGTAAAVGGSVGPIAIGMGGLAGAALLAPAEQHLATVPVTTFVVGSTLASIPAALLMQRVGRRAGFLTGAFGGMAGAAIAAWAILTGSFLLFSLAMAFLGAAAAFGQQYRFAAADAAEPEFKPRAIAWVLAGGVVTGVLGPQIAIHGRGLTPDAPYAGPFFVLVGVFLLTAVILARLDLPRPAPAAIGAGQGRPLARIVLQPAFLVAMLIAISSFSLMSLVMTATPLAMVEHHHSTTDAQLGIQWHVIAMFGPSFFTGGLIARFGKPLVAGTGLVLIALAAAVGLSGTELVHFWTALVLLGIGWNFGFVAATAMTSELYRPEEAFRVQAVNEFALFGIVAVATFSSGRILTEGGWHTVNLVVYPVVAIALALLVLQTLRDKRSRAAA